MRKSPYNVDIKMTKYHRYTYLKENRIQTISNTVTKAISNEKFNKDAVVNSIINNIGNCKNYRYVNIRNEVDLSSPNAKQLLSQKILELWDYECKRGTRAHEACEDWINDEIYPIDDEMKKYVDYLKVYLKDQKDKGFIPVHTELRVLDTELTTSYTVNPGIAGTVDLILYNEKDKIYKMVDFKTTESVSDEKQLKWMHQLGMYHLIILRGERILGLIENMNYSADELSIFVMKENGVREIQYRSIDCLTKLNGKIVDRKYFVGL